MGGDIAVCVFLRHDVDSSEQGRSAEHSAGRSFKNLDALNVAYVYRKIECVVTGLRVADVHSVEKNSDLLLVSAPDADVGLRSNRSALPHIHSGCILQQIIDTLYRRSFNILALQYSNHSRCLSMGQRSP